jgi:transposase-like protein
MHEVGAIVILQLLSCQKWPPATIFFARRRAIKKLVWGLLQVAPLKEEGKCPEDLEHRQVKYLNNRVEADHGKLKRLINPVRRFQSMKTAYATIKGFTKIDNSSFRKNELRN